jgi:hypothetical protein
MRLTSDERALLEKLSNDELRFLSQFSEEKNYTILVKIANYFIDIEKNQFFKETKFTNEELAHEHSFARGSVAGITKFVHVIAASKQELARRDKKNDK